MGQIFHANCYAHSGAVLSMHYLFRKRPYHIMWGGGHVSIDDNLENFTRTEDLLGISTFWHPFGFDMDSEEILSKKSYDKIKFIDENSKSWERLKVWKEALEYFDWDNTRSVSYNDYLVNHIKKQAIDLADYHRQSKFLNSAGDFMAIDLVPVLTETGGGTPMALFDGASAESTEELAGEWCGDLLQIVDELPEDYQLINCCFAEIWGRARYCYHTFGVNKEGFLLSDSNGKLFQFVTLNMYGKRSHARYMKVEETDDNKIRYSEHEGMEQEE